MAININFTANGCSGEARHDEWEISKTGPAYKGEFTLSSSMQLSVIFSDVGEGDFNFDVGYVAIGANGIQHSNTGRLHFGTLGSGNYGYGNSVTLSSDLSDLTFPITFYFVCAGCDWQYHQNIGDPIDTGSAEPEKWLSDRDESPLATWNIIDARHTHITAPAAPIITSTTGKTITVSNGKDGLYCTTISDGWYDTPHTFTNLTQGSSYAFKCRQNCPDCPDNKVFESATVTGKTWSISGSFAAAGAKSIVFKATHVAGTGGDASAHTITYKLYTTRSTSGTAVATKTGINGIPVTFTDLEPGKTYYCYAYTTNLGSGDNNCWIDGDTKTETKVQSNTGDVSATTLRASVSWNAGGAKSVTCTMSCNGTSRTLSSSGSYVGFTGLTPGLTYTVSWLIVSIYTYTYTYTVINGDGETETKTGTGTESYEYTGSASFTTKKAQFGTPINITSKIIQFKSKSNYSSDTMEQKINSNSSWNSVEQDTYVIYNNLTHNTSYTIYCRIAGCYAFNTSGGITSVNDSEISQTVSTYLLSLSGSISEEHQHSLVTLWQAYVNGVATNSDAVDGTSFEFSYMDTIARKSNPPYQASEVIEASNGSTTGDYQTDKKIYSRNLTWYYCEYIITASITDGFNIVAAAVIAHTLFPAAWIYSGGQWHRYMGYVYNNGRYVPAPAFIYKNNRYTEPNGE